MTNNTLKYLLTSFILCLAVFYSGSAKAQGSITETKNINNYIPSKNTEEIILARIGDKVITLTEFYERAEYTIRPRYAKGNSEHEKKIILNSLIAEKLLVLERGGNSRLFSNEKFQNTILGRKEQVMRQLLFHDEGYSKVEIDSSDFVKEFKMAGRTYDVEFMNITDEVAAEYIKRQIEADTISFARIYKELTGDENVPKNKIQWNSPEYEEVSNLLFGADTVKDNQIFGPVKLPGSFLFFKVTGWIDKPALSTNDQTLRYKNVNDKLRVEKGVHHYADFIRTTMKGKRIEFDRNTFLKIVKAFAPIYNIDANQIKQQFSQRALDAPSEIDQKFLKVEEELQGLLNEPFFTIDGQLWTVAMFEEERQKHPLVFRDKKVGGKEFPQQFRFAVVDMIRDKYLTQVCYERGYDKEFIVNRVNNMWSDALVSFYEQMEFMQENNVKEFLSYDVIDKTFRPFIDKLQEKYSDVIEINIEEYNKIKLTRIDFFAVQKNVPFPIIVPAFPQITNDYQLEYGKKMNIDK